MKKLTLLTLILFTFIETEAQDTFNKRYSFGYLNAILGSMEVTDSCYYAMGVAFDTLAPHPLGSLFVKFDLEGNVNFSKLLVKPGSTYYTYNNTSLKTTDNNYLISSLIIDTISTGFSLIKYNTNGDTIFTKKYEHPYFPQENFIIQNDMVRKGSNYYLIGNIVKPSTPFRTDPYLIKTDEFGNKLWDKLYGFDEWSDNGRSLLAHDNGLIIGGYSSNTNFTFTDYIARTYLIGIDTAGNVQWEYLTPEGELFYRAWDVIPAIDGGLIIASGKGTERSTANPNFSVLEWDNYIFKIDNNQEFVWGTTLIDSIPVETNQLRKLIAVSDQSGYVSVGSTYKRNFVAGVLDYFGVISKIAVNGDSLWSRYLHYVESSNAQHKLYDAEETPDGGFILVGEANDLQVDPPDPPNQQGWLIKVDEHGCLVPGCHLISSTKNLQSVVPFQLKLYPNPASDYLNIYFHHPAIKGEAHFSLQEVSGKTVKQFSSGMGDVTHMWQVDDLPAGVYWLTCRVAEAVLTQEVVIAR